MTSSKKVLLVASTCAVLLVAAGIALLAFRGGQDTAAPESLTSHYVGEETRGIVALSQSDVDGLLAGAGTPFGGMAKPAELNGYPGPRHVLDAAEIGDLDLDEDQLEQIEGLYAEMQSEAIPLGEQIVQVEQAIDDSFSSGTMTETALAESIAISADLYGRLRTIHLSNHLATVEILDPEQIARYNELRGYSNPDPCAAPAPEGHDPELWRQHNNCQ